MKLWKTLNSIRNLDLCRLLVDAAADPNGRGRAGESSEGHKLQGSGDAGFGEQGESELAAVCCGCRRRSTQDPES